MVETVALHFTMEALQNFDKFHALFIRHSVTDSFALYAHITVMQASAKTQWGQCS